MHQDGNLTHNCGWSGGLWKELDGGMIYMEFNGVNHTMVFNSDKKNLILINPMRNPPSVATFVAKDKSKEELAAYEPTAPTHEQPILEMHRIELDGKATVKSSHSVQGGGTGREFRENILKSGTEAWNKWYAVGT